MQRSAASLRRQCAKPSPPDGSPRCQMAQLIQRRRIQSGARRPIRPSNGACTPARWALTPPLERRGQRPPSRRRRRRSRRWRIRCGMPEVIPPRRIDRRRSLLPARPDGKRGVEGPDRKSPAREDEDRCDRPRPRQGGMGKDQREPADAGAKADKLNNYGRGSTARGKGIVASGATCSNGGTTRSCLTTLYTRFCSAARYHSRASSSARFAHRRAAGCHSPAHFIFSCDK